jgi:hypothetical protein
MDPLSDPIKPSGKPSRTTWEDCVAALRSGLPPLSLVKFPLDGDQDRPQHANTFAESGLATNSDHGDPAMSATSRLYHRFTGLDGLPPQTLQMVYLRPPFSLWDHVDATRKDNDSRHALGMMDTELTFDLRSLFRPRFVQPPEFEFECSEPKTALDVSATGSHHASSSVDRRPDDRMADECESDDTSVASMGQQYGGHPLPDEHMDAVADRLTAFLLDDKSPGFDSLHAETARLCRWQWSVIYGRIAGKIEMDVSRAMKLVSSFGSCALGEFVLLSAAPHLASSPSDDAVDDIETLLEAAIAHVKSGGWTCFDLGDRMDVGDIGTCASLPLSRCDVTTCLGLSL